MLTAQARVAFLSPLIFNIFINSIAADIRRACVGVSLGPELHAPCLTVLLYADDIVTLAESQHELQLAFDAVFNWGNRWRCRFGIGPTKTAVLCVNPPRSMPPPCTLGNSSVPFVSEYPYLGIWFTSNCSWSRHATHLCARGEMHMSQCLSWALQERLPLQWACQLFESYVLPSAMYGSELMVGSSSMAVLQKRLLRWGRRLLGWPAGTPTAAVLAELGWHSTRLLSLRRATYFYARLRCIANNGSRQRMVEAVFRYAQSQSHSFACKVIRELSAIGFQVPSEWSIGPGVPRANVRSWCRTIASPIFTAAAQNEYRNAAASVPSLSTFLECQPWVGLQRRVRGRACFGEDAREWSLARCGHHPCSDGRALRHRCAHFPCPCGAISCTLEHALLFCPRCAVARARWLQHVGQSLPVNTRLADLPWIFAAEHPMCTASSVAANVSFMSLVCRHVRSWHQFSLL